MTGAGTPPIYRGKMRSTTLEHSDSWDWPPEAREVILKDLQDRSGPAEDREAAAGLAGRVEVIDEELAGLLVSLVADADEDEALRARAAIALGPVLELCDTDGFDEISDAPIAEGTFDRIRSELRRLYADTEVPALVRRRILEAAVRAPEDWHADAIRAAYGSEERDWRLTAVFAMAYIQGFDTEILQALESDDEEILFQAVDAAGNWQVQEAFDRVRGLAASADTDKDVRLAAIEAVAAIRPRSAPALLNDLLDDPDEDVALVVQEALAMGEVLGELEDLE